MKNTKPTTGPNPFLEIDYCCQFHRSVNPSEAPFNTTSEQRNIRAKEMLHLMLELAEQTEISEDLGLSHYSSVLFHMHKDFKNAIAAYGPEVAFRAFGHYALASFAFLCREALDMKDYDGVDLEPFLAEVVKVKEPSLIGELFCLSHVNTQISAALNELQETWDIAKVKTSWQSTLYFMKRNTDFAEGKGVIDA